MYSLVVSIFIICIKILKVTCESSDCLTLKTSITQKIEHEGFHREIWWLLETSEPSTDVWLNSECKLILRLDVTSGMFINPDEIGELRRMGELCALIVGQIDIEAAAHEANEHVLYIFLNNSMIDKMQVFVPFHLRYQRAQIAGDYGKVGFRNPSLLTRCPKGLNQICNKGLKVEAPCDENNNELCIWRNVSYSSYFDNVELFVPVGDLDHYPLVSIVTLLLGCAGCIYILSVLSSSHL
ncbi:phosphatidylinositol-glycan biosynthesis class X protein-like [Diorhabda carinulata]|uniref:phosphatidylinositol-glycan biosynthesis class X protein-like n=1 Tax=Diorhabda sublineata TaxID=1163346 RepID=UPI0024E063F4|nr:phosphatidylinositol-glycan biosynthesis class X protein-like [Diorhabda sublineata]XP_057661812.1 phosphatidylinositol-glycan biosynthesis class X protein-like [Diorhabda carinulata]